MSSCFSLTSIAAEAIDHQRRLSSNEASEPGLDSVATAVQQVQQIVTAGHAVHGATFCIHSTLLVRLDLVPSRGQSWAVRWSCWGTHFREACAVLVASNPEDDEQRRHDLLASQLLKLKQTQKLTSRGE